MARALEIPAVVAVNGLMDAVKDGDKVVLDGSTGEVFVDPEASVEKEYEEKRKQFLKDKKELEKYIGQPSVTKDGVQVEIVANIGKPEDVDKGFFSMMEQYGCISEIISGQKRKPW